jgi:general secretion pathway protein G
MRARVAWLTVAAVMAFPAVTTDSGRRATDRTREAVLKEDLFRLRGAIARYYADRKQYPATLQDLATRGYLRAIPVDAMTGAPDWRVVRVGGAIRDVKSASDQRALDGSRYGDWN